MLDFLKMKYPRYFIPTKSATCWKDEFKYFIVESHDSTVKWFNKKKQCLILDPRSFFNERFCLSNDQLKEVPEEELALLI